MIERLALFARVSRASQRSSKPKRVWAVSLSAIAPKPADASTLSTGISISPSRIGAAGPPKTCSSTPKKLASVRRSSSSNLRGEPRLMNC